MVKLLSTEFDKNFDVKINSNPNDYVIIVTNDDVSEQFTKDVQEIYQSINENVLIFKTLFSENEANFAWNKYYLVDKKNNKVISKIEKYNGIKTSGEWVVRIPMAKGEVNNG